MSNPAADFAATRFELSTDAAGLWDRMADLTTLLSYVPGVGAVTSEGSIVSARMRLKLSAVPAVYRILADWESRDDASRTAVLNVLATDRRTSRVRHLRLRTTVADGAGGGCELRVVLEPGRTSPRRASMRLPQARFWTGWCLSSPDGSWTHRCPPAEPTAAPVALGPLVAGGGDEPNAVEITHVPEGWLRDPRIAVAAKSGALVAGAVAVLALFRKRRRFDNPYAQQPKPHARLGTREWGREACRATFL